MDLLDLAREAGLTPKREGKTCYSPCPACDGKDRFIIWPENNRYWCRRCERHGDAIQFCRDFLGMDYFEACKKLNITITLKSPHTRQRKVEKFISVAKHPSDLWLHKSLAFTLWCNEQLLKSPDDLSRLYERGFSIETIEKFHLGLCRDPFKKIATGFFRDRPLWGLEQEFNKSGKEKKLWLPYGIVIPYYDAEGQVVKLKIRRLDWHPKDLWPKYVEVSGSMQKPAWFGSLDGLPVVIVEAEFDAILIRQVADDLCSVVALGGVKKRPDLATDQRLRKNPLLLYALDFDEAGKEEFLFWRNAYSHLRAWPVPITKSPGDAFKAGVNIRQWILDGIERYKLSQRRNVFNESSQQAKSCQS